MTNESLRRDVLDKLRSALGEKAQEVLNDLIALYLDDAPRLMQTMRQAAAGRDARRLHLAAHTLKSSSANLGAQALSDQSAELEQLARAGQLDEAAARIARLDAEYQRVKQALLAEMEP